MLICVHLYLEIIPLKRNALGVSSGNLAAQRYKMVRWNDVLFESDLPRHPYAITHPISKKFKSNIEDFIVFEELGPSDNKIGESASYPPSRVVE